MACTRGAEGDRHLIQRFFALTPASDMRPFIRAATELQQIHPALCWIGVIQQQLCGAPKEIPISAWPCCHVAQAKKLLQGVTVQRITFVEVTRAAVLAALATPRQLATNLIEAYMARRALDYLLGFHLTPVLWRKLPAARSAGKHFP